MDQVTNSSDLVAELTEILRRFDIVDLSHTLQEGMPTFPTHSKFFHMPWPQPDDPALMYQILMHEHNGTHVDAPAHLLRREIDPTRDWMHAVAPGSLLGPCNVLHVAEGPADGLIDLERIRTWERTNWPIQRGDVVILNTGTHRSWSIADQGRGYRKAWPGLSLGASEYLADTGVRAVGIDTLGLDAKDSVDLPAHDTLLKLGILIMENLTNLDALPRRCFFLAVPLKIFEGSASPIRALALVPKEEVNA